MNTNRFLCASSGLSLGELLKHGRRALLLGFGLAIATHLCLTQITGLGEEEKAIKPLTTQFIKRAPRLTKPLELKKRPQPRQRRMRRKMVAVKAKVDRKEMSAGFQPVQTVQSFARPDMDVSRKAFFASNNMEPEAVAQVIEGAKEAKQVVDMSLEMVDIEALDTGRFHAMVIEDPTDKRNVRGFFHLAIVHIQTLAERAGTNTNRADAALARLVESLNAWTNIKADIRYRCDFDSPEVLKTPWIYAGSFKNFVLTDSEIRSLGTYLTVGGFFFANEWISIRHQSFEATERAFKNMYKQALATQNLMYGRDWAFEQLAQQPSYVSLLLRFRWPSYWSNLEGHS